MRKKGRKTSGRQTGIMALSAIFRGALPTTDLWVVLSTHPRISTMSAKKWLFPLGNILAGLFLVMDKWSLTYNISFNNPSKQW